jgi:selenocysteine-specific elongation factor
LKDNIRLLPQDRMVRVRGLQRHGRAAESVAAGERAAVNLAGVSASELHRGNELVAPGAYEGSTRMIVELVMHAGARHPVRHRGTVRLHLAAAEVTAKVLLAAPELRAESEPSGDARTGESPAEYAVLVCAGPVIAEYGQPFVVRALSPTATIGGGRVLAPQIPGGARLGDCLRCASRLASEDPLTRLCGLLDLSARPEEPGHALAVRVGVAVEALRPMFELLATDGRVLPLGEPARYVSAARVERLAGELERVCERELERRRPSRLLPASVVTGRLERRIDPQVIEAAMSLLLRQGRMIMRDNRIGPSDSGDSGTSMPPGGAATPAAGRAGQLTAAASPRGMTHRQRQILGGFQKQCEESGWTPPTLKEYAAQHRLRESELAALVQFAVDDGLLVRVSPELAIPPDVLESLRQSLQDLLAIAAGVTVAQIRDHWSMTRKHAIPYLEFLDRLGVTVRDGDVRRAGPRFHESLDEIIP